MKTSKFISNKTSRFFKLFIIIFFSCILCFASGLLSSSAVFACAWYGGADGSGNGGSGAGKTPNGGCDEKTVANPVGVATGSCLERATDLFVSSPGIPVVFKRYFNNLDLRVSSIGWGWRLSLDVRVIFVSDSAGDITHAVIINPNGRRDTYTKGVGDIFDPPAGVYSSLTLNPDGTAILKTKDNLTYTFNQGGRLIGIRDLNDNTLAINYTDNSSTAEIVTVVDSVGRGYNFTYENGKIKTITDPAGRQVTYTYNGNLLTAVTNPLNETMQYGYDPATFDLLTKTSPKGDTYVTNTYDTQGRVINQNHAGKTYDFTYKNGYTEVTEQGQYISTYYYNTTYNFTTKYIDPLGKETIYDWDIITLLIMSVTDPLGNVTSFDYYADGKLWTVTQTISASESKTTTYQ